MDVQALANVVGTTSGSSVVAVQVPSDVRAALGSIATQDGLTGSDRSALVQAVASASQLSGTARTQALSQVEGLGVYLRHTGDEGLPRWTMMSALRAYGLNLQQNSYPAGISESAVAKNVQAQLESIAASRGASLPQALNVAQAVTAVQAVAPVVADVVAASRSDNGGGDGTPRVQKIV